MNFERRKKIEDAAKRSGEDLKRIAKDTADFFIERATQYVAKDTATLQKAIPFLKSEEIVSAIRESWSSGTAAAAGHIVTSLNLRVPYAGYVEYGTAPHMPPVEPLINWARRHGWPHPEKAGWALAKHIEREGLDPHPFIRPALNDARDYFAQHLKGSGGGPSGGRQGQEIATMISRISSFGDRLWSRAMGRLSPAASAAGLGKVFSAARRVIK